ncbi:Glycosyltransferase involved in cell wall bisynthesis [Prevotella sp. kh1p2]|nr:Glycosyltransferase involved in cell wall bisynthesis [Prevotella sp. kh1p2]SNU11802.1 Glycosyltransferase involved in cell wall bisynthesis [Prevotellaceae bacterium KH2P17]
MQLTGDNSYKLIKWGVGIKYLRKYMKEYKPQVAICILGVTSLIAKIASFGLDIEIISTDHNSFERPVDAPLTKVHYISKFWLNKIYKNVTVLTKADKKYIGKRLKHVTVMPNPLSLDPLSIEDRNRPLPNETKIVLDSKENIILAAGRLDAWFVKGFDLLIKAWGELQERYKSENKILDWKLQIAGKGSEKSLRFLRDICKTCGVIDSVEFLGFQTCMEEIFKKASVFVLSSRYEGFGLVLIEAMSQGCACIAADYRGRQSEIITNSGEGILYEPNNQHTLTNSIEKLIENLNYRKELQVGAILRSKYYTLDKTIDRWETFLNNFI